MLSRCCPCLGRKAVEAFEQAADKKFGKPSGADKETKGLLDTYGLDEDIEEAGEEGVEFDVKGPISSDRIKALLDRQVALTNEIDNEFDDDDEDDDAAAAAAPQPSEKS